MWFPTHQADIVLKQKNVNNKHVANEIDVCVMKLINTNVLDLFNDAKRSHVADLIEDFMSDMEEKDGKISQIAVLCDSRNNTAESLKTKKVNILVKYRQKNCLNTTELAYSVGLKSL